VLSRKDDPSDKHSIKVLYRFSHNSLAKYKTILYGVKLKIKVNHSLTNKRKGPPEDIENIVFNDIFKGRNC